MFRFYVHCLSFFFSPAQGLTQTHRHPGFKWTERECDHSITTGTEVNKRGAVSPRLHLSSWHASDKEDPKWSLTVLQRWICWLHVIPDSLECKLWSQICAGSRKDEPLLWRGFSLVKYNVKLSWTRHDEIWRNGGVAPLILNFGTRWRWVSSYMCRSHLPSELELLYTFIQ